MTDNLNPYKIGCPKCGSMEFWITETTKFKEVTPKCSKPVIVQTCDGCGNIIKTQVNHDPCETDGIVELYEKLCNTEGEYELVSIPQRRRKKILQNE